MVTPSWFAHHRKRPAGALKLFCFPYAGGSAAVFRGWIEPLAPRIAVLPIELPGHGLRGNEAPFTDMTSLVNTLLEQLDPEWNEPFAFFGHSMGAVIAYELARALLKDSRRAPARLFVSGRRSPDDPSDRPPTHGLSDGEFMEELRRLKGTPTGILADVDLMKILLPTLRTDFEMIEKYSHEPGPLLECPVSAFGGLEDTDVGYEATSGWRRMTTGPFTIRMFPGDHFFLHSAMSRVLQLIHLDLAGVTVR